jgi:hypothetical protein
MEDREMILRPVEWPRWPTLPVKRFVEHELKCGFIVAEHSDPAKPVTIYESSIYNLPNGCKTWGDVLAGIPEEKRRRYDNVDAMLADGWMVD